MSSISNLGQGWHKSTTDPQDELFPLVNKNNKVIGRITRKEELGLKVKDAELKYVGETLVVLPWEQEYFAVYEYQLASLKTVNFSKEEITDVQFMSMKDIVENIKENPEKWSDKAR